jgi:dihydroorotase-like cyclic amidohydrolase
MFALCLTPKVEAEAVNRAVVLASQAGAPVYVGGITGKRSAEIVSRSRRKGIVIFSFLISRAYALSR